MPAVPATTGPQLDWIVQATDVLDSGPTPSRVSGVPLDVIDQTLVMASLVSRALPGNFFDWIANALDNFRELLNDFTGDSGAIVAHAEHCSATADLVRTQVAPIASAPSCAPQWTGSSALGFSHTMRATAECVAATADSIEAVGVRHLVLAGMVAHTKSEIIRAVTQLAVRLVKGALEAIARAGLALAEGAVTVIGGTVSGAAHGAWEGFKRGGPIGAIAGGISGGASGAREAAEEAARRLRAAWDAFVAWGAEEVAHVLEALTEFTERAIEPMVAEIGQIKGVGQRAERAVSLLRSGRDPGYNADAPPEGTAGHDAQGTEMQDQDRDLIDLNQAIGDPSAELPDGYTRATPEDLAALGITQEMLTDENGFIAEVFMGPDGPVVAFAGTTSGENPATGVNGEVIKDDVIEDAAGGFTQSPQTQQVLAISEAISNSPGGDNVVFTGHSLGGRLATIASLDTGNAAITYNSAGVSQATVDYIAASNNMTPEELASNANAGQVRRYWTGDDLLTAAQERWTATRDVAPDALGAPIQLGEVAPATGTGHQQDNVEKKFDETFPE